MRLKPVFSSFGCVGAIVAIAAAAFLGSAQGADQEGSGKCCGKNAPPKPAAAKNSCSKPIAQAKLLVSLPERYNTPDGMCLLPSGDVIVSVPNINNRAYPPVLLKLRPDNSVEEFYRCEPHPETGEAYPFGVACDDKGDIYLTDLQWFANPDNPGRKSRILWIPVRNGKPGKAKTIAEGMVVANAVLIRDGFMYVTDTTMMPGTKPLITGVYRFPLEEAKKKTITLTPPLDEDPHTIATIETHNPDIPFGADGLTMDSHGNLFIGNFADGTVHKVTFDAQGNPSKPTLFAKAPFMKSCDGLYCDLETDIIYVADSIANAVQMVYPDGSVRTLARDGENDGSGGRLDQPSEPVLRGDELIVCNFDMPVPGGVNKKFDPPYTISVIKLPNK